MNDIAVVAPVVDIEQIGRAVHAAHIALRDAESETVTAISKADRMVTGAREKEGQRRLALGRLLVEARKAWPARGPKAKGWGEFLTRQGIGQRAAHDWMSLAGYVEVSAPEDVGAEIPTRRQVEAARKPAPDPDAPPDDWVREVAARREQTVMPDPPTRSAPAPRAVDPVGIEKELASISGKLIAAAKTWTPRGRRDLAMELRAVANLIEEMDDE